MVNAPCDTTFGHLRYRFMTTNTTADWTSKQGQFLAFIYYYTKIMRQAPAESDFQRYFRTHQMIVTLGERGFISREGRTIQLLLSRDQIPDLD